MPTLRLLIDPPAAGAWNMAVDEALLASAAAGVATLRFYTWSEPTLSLGYCQPARQREAHAASRSCPLVRRASGGGAILHDRELTYSLAVPLRQRFGAQAGELYQIAHHTLVQSLRALRVVAHVHDPAAGEAAATEFLCFQRRTRGDVLCGPAKIAGSAQRRSRGAILQHGSVLLGSSPCAPELPGIEQLSGVRVTAEQLLAIWHPPVAVELRAAIQPGKLTNAERANAAAIERERFSSPGWTLRR
jgi:lipoate-protein ligase A